MAGRHAIGVQVQAFQLNSKYVTKGIVRFAASNIIPGVSFHKIKLSLHQHTENKKLVSSSKLSLGQGISINGETNWWADRRGNNAQRLTIDFQI